MRIVALLVTVAKASRHWFGLNGFDWGRFHLSARALPGPTSEYSGPTVCGAPEGDGGRCVWSNGDSYTGQWYEGVRAGWGEYHWADGSRFEGTYLNNQMLKGTFTYPEGSQYIGNFNFLSELSLGEFLVDEFHGEGELHYFNGDMYFGLLFVSCFTPKVQGSIQER